jgi:hypothetical protein
LKAIEPDVKQELYDGAVVILAQHGTVLLNQPLVSLAGPVNAVPARHNPRKEFNQHSSRDWLQVVL